MLLIPEPITRATPRKQYLCPPEKVLLRNGAWRVPQTEKLHRARPCTGWAVGSVSAVSSPVLQQSHEEKLALPHLDHLPGAEGGLRSLGSPSANEFDAKAFDIQVPGAGQLSISGTAYEAGWLLQEVPTPSSLGEEQAHSPGLKHKPVSLAWALALQVAQQEQLVGEGDPASQAGTPEGSSALGTQHTLSKQPVPSQHTSSSPDAFTPPQSP
ncbi:hypothetical protein P7K49_030954 [Saguinus oedipus]|uniref:Uncharacterized protein n=1 Tax=Saguinus oedipus TaxID=9490 RepID=A0ABQ9U3M3_SAGOE|nr:hypothetical protein P7K49_030954 [Saguinus oedipus]